MEVIPPDATAAGPAPPPGGPPTPTSSPVGRRAGASVSAVGGLGALVGFGLPWFIFLAAVQSGCRAQIVQIELYDLYGAALAVGQAGVMGAALAVAAAVCAVVIVITAIMSVRRLVLFRIRLLVVASLVGLGLLGLLAALVMRGRLAPNGAVIYSVFRAIGFGFWVTAGSLVLALVGGAALHAAARPLRRGAPAGEIALALLGVVGLLTAMTATVVVHPPPYPSLTCAQRASAPLAGGAAVYVTSADGVYALDAASGQARWSCRNPLGGVVTDGAPPLADGVLYVASRDGYVYAIRAEDAAIVWRADVGGRGSDVTQAPHVAPIVADGLVIGVNGAGQVYALRANDGARAWATPLGSLIVAGAAAPMLGDGALIFPAYEKSNPYIISLDARTGQRRWESPISAIFLGSKVPMLLDHGIVYDAEVSAQGGGSYLAARSAATGVTRWRYTLVAPGAGGITSMFTVVDGGVYFEQRREGPPVVMALRADDGSVMWSVPAPDVLSDPRAPAAPLTPLARQAPELAPTPTPPATPPGQSFTPTPSAQSSPQVAPTPTPSPATQIGQWAQVTLATDASSVYVAVSSVPGAAQNTVYRFNARNGAVLWRRDVSHSVTSPPFSMTGQPSLTVTDSTVYLEDSSGALSSLGARTGARRWLLSAPPLPANWAPTQGAIVAVSAPASSSAGRLLYVATARLFAISLPDGAVRWQFTPDKPTAPCASSAVRYMPIVSPIISPPTLAS